MGTMTAVGSPLSLETIWIPVFAMVSVYSPANAGNRMGTGASLPFASRFACASLALEVSIADVTIRSRLDGGWDKSSYYTNGQKDCRNTRP
jgi:hypothetical protein